MNNIINSFEPLNKAYNSVFKPGKMSIGLVVPIENYSSKPVPTMKNHLNRVQLAEELGFSSIWLRDVPFNVPSFGDAGQLYDPFVYLGYLAANTSNIALGVASIVLPLRHPAHVAKAAASIDNLSGGRIILGIASGDRLEEYPVFNTTYEARGKNFREAFSYVRNMSEDYPVFENDYGSSNGNIDMLPKPISKKIPLLITGGSQQSPDWIAQHGDGWMIYPRDIITQAKIINQWRKNISKIEGSQKPVMEPLYIDLTDNPDTAPRPIHLGLKLGVNHLIKYLHLRKEIGVNHVALNLRFNNNNIETTMKQLAKNVLPEFQ